MLKTLEKIILCFIFILFTSHGIFAKEIRIDEKEIFLTDLNHINITNDLAKDIKQIKELVNRKRPKALYIEQWLLLEPHNKKLLSDLHKITKKYNAKLYLVIGKNTWFGHRGVSNTLEAYKLYGKEVDGIVLRVEPNKANVWKDDMGLKAQVLNQMLDAYSAIHNKFKKENKQFVAEFPFWLSDFKGPLRSFPEDVCHYADKIIFLIDDPEKLDTLEIKWNDVTCRYNINLTKRATTQTEESLNEIYKKLKTNLTFYSNFNGFIIDSDSKLLSNEQ